MRIAIRIEVQAPPDVEAQQVVDEITSNIESCGWAVISVGFKVVASDSEGGKQ